MCFEGFKCTFQIQCRKLARHSIVKFMNNLIFLECIIMQKACFISTKNSKLKIFNNYIITRPDTVRHPGKTLEVQGISLFSVFYFPRERLAILDVNRKMLACLSEHVGLPDFLIFSFAGSVAPYTCTYTGNLPCGMGTSFLQGWYVDKCSQKVYKL